MNGTIRMKEDEKDTKWLNINNLDDLFKYLGPEDKFDLKHFNKGLHRFKVLEQKSMPVPFTPDISSDDDDDV